MRPWIGASSAVVLFACAFGCAHRHGRVEKLPGSVLRRQPQVEEIVVADDAGKSMSSKLAVPTDPMGSAAMDSEIIDSDPNQVESDHRRFGFLRRNQREGRRPLTEATDESTTPPVRSVLRMPDAAPDIDLPQRIVPTAPGTTVPAASPPQHVVGSVRNDAFENSKSQRLDLEIRNMIADIEATDASQVSEFISAIRRATTPEETEIVLSAWRATTSYLKRSAAQEKLATPPRNDASASPRPLSTTIESTRTSDHPSPPPSTRPGAPRAFEPQAGPSNAPQGSSPPSAPHEPSADNRGIAIPVAVATTQRIKYREDDLKQTSATEMDSPRSDRAMSATSMPQEATPAFNVARQPETEWERRVRELAAAIDAAGGAEPGSRVRIEAFRRLLYLIGGDHRQAVQTILDAEPNERRFWQNLLWALAQYFDEQGIPKPEDRVRATIEAINTALAALEQQADLMITTPVLCREVVNFGNYTEFEKYEFAAAQTVVAYWEVKNFTSAETKEGFRTRLDASFVIYDSLGNKRHEFDRSFPDDLCASRRRDYFMVARFSWPKDLPPGEYILEASVSDKTSNKHAAAKRRFKIASATR